MVDIPLSPPLSSFHLHLFFLPLLPSTAAVSHPPSSPSPYSLFRRGLSPPSIFPLPYKGRIRKLDEGSPPPSLPLRSVQSCWSDIDGRDAVVLQYGVRVLCSAHNLSRFFLLPPSSFPYIVVRGGRGGGGRKEEGKLYISGGCVIVGKEGLSSLAVGVTQKISRRNK